MVSFTTFLTPFHEEKSMPSLTRQLIGPRLFSRPTVSTKTSLVARSIMRNSKSQYQSSLGVKSPLVLSQPHITGKFPFASQQRFVSIQADSQKTTTSENTSNQQAKSNPADSKAEQKEQTGQQQTASNKQRNFFNSYLPAGTIGAAISWYLKGEYDRKTKNTNEFIEQKQKELEEKWGVFKQYLTKLSSEASPLIFKKKLHFYNPAQINDTKLPNTVLNISKKLEEIRKEIKQTRERLQKIVDSIAHQLGGINLVFVYLAWLPTKKKSLDMQLTDCLQTLNYLENMNEAYMAWLNEPKPNTLAIDKKITDAIQIIKNKTGESFLGIDYKELRANAYNLQAKIRRVSNDFQGSETAYKKALQEHSTAILHSNLGALLVDVAYQHIPTVETITACAETKQCEEAVTGMKNHVERAIYHHEQAVCGMACTDLTETEWQKMLREKDLQILTDYALALRVLACSIRLEYSGQAIPPDMLKRQGEYRQKAHELLDKVITVLDDPKQAPRRNEVNPVQPHMYKGILYMDVGNVAKAREQFIFVQKLNPMQPQAAKRLKLLDEKAGKLNDWTLDSCCVQLKR